MTASSSGGVAVTAPMEQDDADSAKTLACSLMITKVQAAKDKGRLLVAGFVFLATHINRDGDIRLV